MMGLFSNRYFQLLLRLVIGGLFVYASLNKVFNQQEFAKAIYNYKLLPGGLVNLFAIVLPYIEFFAGIFLIFGIFKKGSSFLIGSMLVVFIIALTRAYVLGLDISCGCFSLETVSEKSDILQRIIEDILMLIGCILIYFKSDKKNLTITNN